CQQHYSTPVTF
nr:immunoglobulin light chain junction region [Mus musculus]NSL97589.1 immunoglobulin light chain junction region [Mus musculus]NSL99048.1 immunoglobulin light chain junction region [Mus musculus]NSL99121.1 immunoglobulin light chain junction region [Mus musculus]NSL99961.1 immunoglobulin light chain junction region [Mus musculus]